MQNRIWRFKRCVELTKAIQWCPNQILRTIWFVDPNDDRLPPRKKQGGFGKPARPPGKTNTEIVKIIYKHIFKLLSDELGKAPTFLAKEAVEGPWGRLVSPVFFGQISCRAVAAHGANLVARSGGSN